MHTVVKVARYYRPVDNAVRRPAGETGTARPVGSTRVVAGNAQRGTHTRPRPQWALMHTSTPDETVTSRPKGVPCGLGVLCYYLNRKERESQAYACRRFLRQNFAVGLLA